MESFNIIAVTLHANWLFVDWICSWRKTYLLLIRTFFIFNIHLYLINEYRVKIKFLEQKNNLQKNSKVVIIMIFQLHQSIVLKCSINTEH